MQEYQITDWSHEDIEIFKNAIVEGKINNYSIQKIGSVVMSKCPHKRMKDVFEMFQCYLYLELHGEQLNDQTWERFKTNPKNYSHNGEFIQDLHIFNQRYQAKSLTLNELIAQSQSDIVSGNIISGIPQMQPMQQGGNQPTMYVTMIDGRIAQVTPMFTQPVMTTSPVQVPQMTQYPHIHQQVPMGIPNVVSPIQQQQPIYMMGNGGFQTQSPPQQYNQIPVGNVSPFNQMNQMQMQNDQGYQMNGMGMGMMPTNQANPPQLSLNVDPQFEMDFNARIQQEMQNQDIANIQEQIDDDQSNSQYVGETIAPPPFVQTNQQYIPNQQFIPMQYQQQDVQQSQQPNNQGYQ